MGLIDKQGSFLEVRGSESAFTYLSNNEMPINDLVKSDLGSQNTEEEE